MLNLYLVTRTDEIFRDEYASFVVASSDWLKAGRYHPSGHFAYKDGSWTQIVTTPTGTAGDKLRNPSPYLNNWVQGCPDSKINVKLLGIANPDFKEGQIICSEYWDS